MNKSEQAVYDKYWVTIKDYMLEMQQAWILGSRDINEDWDSYQSQLKRMGYHKVVEAYQSAYDRAYK
jgi:putative aldouronate transport system substrate-binding protein